MARRYGARRYGRGRGRLRGRPRLARDTGRLRASIGAEAAGLGATVRATAAYALFVEIGSGRGPAQPYLGPAFRRAAAELSAASREVIG